MITIGDADAAVWIKSCTGAICMIYAESKTGSPALQRVYAAQVDIAWSYHHCCRGAAHIMLSEVIGSTLKNTKKTQFKEKIYLQQ